MIREINNLNEVSLTQIERLGTLFAKEAGAGKFNIEHFIRMFSIPLEIGVAKIWVIEKCGTIVGLIGGLITPQFFSMELTGIEAFWFVDEENRGSLESGRLLVHFEDWAISNKVTALHLGFMEKIHPERMREFYERRGYKRFETVYRKTL